MDGAGVAGGGVVELILGRNLEREAVARRGRGGSRDDKVRRIARATWIATLPVRLLLPVSVAVTVWLPVASSVTLNRPTPEVSGALGGKTPGVAGGEVDRSGIAWYRVAKLVLGRHGKRKPSPFTRIRSRADGQATDTGGGMTVMEFGPASERADRRVGRDDSLQAGRLQFPREGACAV